MRLPARALPKRLSGAQQRHRQGQTGEREVRHDGPLGPTRQRDDTAEGALGGEQAEGRNRDPQQSSVRGRCGEDDCNEQRQRQNRQHPVGETEVEGAADDDERRDRGSSQGGQPQPGTGRDVTRVRSCTPASRVANQREGVSDASLLGRRSYDSAAKFRPMIDACQIPHHEHSSTARVDRTAQRQRGNKRATDGTESSRTQTNSSPGTEPNPETSPTELPPRSTKPKVTGSNPVGRALFRLPMRRLACKAR